MINNETIVDTWLAHKGRKRTKTGRRDDTLFLMPFFIMDACYQIYCKDIKDIPCRHQMKLAKKRWADCYHKYTMDFFQAFSSDQVDYIVDQMDDFNEYIHNSLVILKSKVVGQIPEQVPFEDKRVLASLLLCNVLAQAAQHLYGNMYRKSDMTKEVSGNIEGVRKASCDMAHYHPLSKGIDLTASGEVMKLIDSLCKRIMKFLNETNRNRDVS